MMVPLAYLGDDWECGHWWVLIEPQKFVWISVWLRLNPSRIELTSVWKKKKDKQTSYKLLTSFFISTGKNTQKIGKKKTVAKKPS
jgi:hypothetical protein